LHWRRGGDAPSTELTVKWLRGKVRTADEFGVHFSISCICGLRPPRWCRRRCRIPRPVIS